VRSVRVFLDNTLEIVIAYARVQTVLSLLGAFAGAGWWIWYGDARYGALAALALVLGALAGWFGYIQFGNEEWRRGTAEDRGTAVRHD
jgi:hypothetical protein